MTTPKDFVTRNPGYELGRKETAKQRPRARPRFADPVRLKIYLEWLEEYLMRNGHNGTAEALEESLRKGYSKYFAFKLHSDKATKEVFTPAWVKPQWETMKMVADEFFIYNPDKKFDPQYIEAMEYILSLKSAFEESIKAVPSQSTVWDEIEL